LPSAFLLTLRPLRAVLRTALLAVLNAQAVETAADDVVTHAGKVADAAAADEHNRVFLQIVAFAADVRGDFLAVGEANRATLRRAELGFFGVVVFTIKHTPRFWGLRCKSLTLLVLDNERRGLRINWLIVGMAK
jgi:hypothetical protein